ncbi:MAG: SDR family oxidoreductase [Cephaloticoccus sp.]|nr:SDR family oxidoreductase [Cephaloticoccus sp.]MCF7760178.1 SDR family oxidoreductase [Cephaloticoccus sp.]
MKTTPEFDETPRPGIRLPDLAGHIALVTGASSGIGRATVEALLANGVIVHGVAHEVTPITHENFQAHLCDLRDPAALKSLISRIAELTSHLDYVVNVAGVDTKASLDEGGAKQWADMVDINLRAYYLILHETVSLLRRGQGRAVVNISSINYRLGVPKRSIYATTKAGILGLTTGLARELGRERIRINTVSPGWVFTEAQVREYFAGAEAEKNLTYLTQVQSLALKIGAGDIANHVLFYLSDVSRASTGHNCVVDAGWTLE